MELRCPPPSPASRWRRRARSPATRKEEAASRERRLRFAASFSVCWMGTILLKRENCKNVLVKYKPTFFQFQIYTWMRFVLEKVCKVKLKFL